MKSRVKHSTIIAAVLLGLLLFGAYATDTGAAYAKASGNPGKVSSMTLTVTGQPLAKIRWKKATGNANGYTIVRNGKTIATVKGKNVLSYVDESLQPGKSYTYKVVPFHKSIKGKAAYGKASPVRKVTKGYTYKKASDGTMILTGFTGRGETVKTPVKIGKAKVRTIGDSCFRGNVWIKKVIVSSGVSKIDDYAFEACGSVKTVSLPKTIKTIGDGAFNGCAQMRYCDMPDSVTAIGKGAFLYCSYLSYVDLPRNLKTMGQFAFAGCERLSNVTFEGNGLTEIPDRAFCNCTRLFDIQIPPCVTSIGKRAFSGCGNLTECTIQGSASIGDYAFERCIPIQIHIAGTENTTAVGFGAFSALYNGYPVGTAIHLSLPDNVEISEGAFYGSNVAGISGDAMSGGNSLHNYTLKEGVLYSKDGKTLIAYFPTKLKGFDFVETDAAKAGEFTVPSGVETIAPYAFYGSKLKKVNLPASLKSIEHNAFTMSGVEQNMLSGGGSAVIDEKAFEDSKYPAQEPFDYDDFDFDDGDDDGDNYVVTNTFEFESMASDGIFDANKYKGYLDIHEGFEEWCQKYIEFNKNNVPMTREAMPYIAMYTGEDHYRQMTSALNGDTYKTQQSILYSGDDYKDMYLMMDHGLFAELSRGRMPGDVLLYSGITPERVSEIAGQEEKAQGPITDELRNEIIERIGTDFTELAVMSVTANIETAFSFSGGEYGSQTIVMIYGSRKALDQLGTICVDEFSTFSGEEEVLFNADAKYRILDVGKVSEKNVYLDPVTGKTIKTEERQQRTYVKLQLLGISKE